MPVNEVWRFTSYDDSRLWSRLPPEAGEPADGYWFVCEVQIVHAQLLMVRAADCRNGRLRSGAARHSQLSCWQALARGRSPHSGGAAQPISSLSEATVLPRARPKAADFEAFYT